MYSFEPSARPGVAEAEDVLLWSSVNVTLMWLRLPREFNHLADTYARLALQWQANWNLDLPHRPGPAELVALLDLFGEPMER